MTIHYDEEILIQDENDEYQVKAERSGRDCVITVFAKTQDNLVEVFRVYSYDDTLPARYKEVCDSLGVTCHG
jgi:hypothetical protein